MSIRGGAFPRILSVSLVAPPGGWTRCGPHAVTLSGPWCTRASHRGPHVAARGQRSGIAYDHAAFSVPTDSVTSPQDAQRAQRVQTSRQVAGASVSTIPSLSRGGRETPVRGDETCAHRLEPSTWLAGLESQTHLAETAIPPGQ